MVGDEKYFAILEALFRHIYQQFLHDALFHEIAWTEYQKILIFSLCYFVKKEGVNSQWTWNNTRWGRFHCELHEMKNHSQKLVHLISYELTMET